VPLSIQLLPNRLRRSVQELFHGGDGRVEDLGRLKERRAAEPDELEGGALSGGKLLEREVEAAGGLPELDELMAPGSEESNWGPRGVGLDPLSASLAGTVDHQVPGDAESPGAHPRPLDEAASSQSPQRP
jgi:hypothetical protein